LLSQIACQAYFLLDTNKFQITTDMAFIDYYKILGVDKDIPQKDVKRAYLKRAKQFHPDLHPDDPKAKAKFQALTEAYDVIGDPDKRSKYDRYGEQWRNADAFGGAGNGAYGYSGGGSPFEGFDFSGFGSSGGGFSSFFNSSAGQAADVHVAATGQVSAVRVEIPAT
jgi:curved DNA-binding protein